MNVPPPSPLLWLLCQWAESCARHWGQVQEETLLGSSQSDGATWSLTTKISQSKGEDRTHPCFDTRVQKQGRQQLNGILEVVLEEWEENLGSGAECSQWGKAS